MPDQNRVEQQPKESQTKVCFPLLNPYTESIDLIKPNQSKNKNNTELPLDKRETIQQNSVALLSSRK